PCKRAEACEHHGRMKLALASAGVLLAVLAVVWWSRSDPASSSGRVAPERELVRDAGPGAPLAAPVAPSAAPVRPAESARAVAQLAPAAPNSPRTPDFAVQALAPGGRYVAGVPVGVRKPSERFPRDVFLAVTAGEQGIAHFGDLRDRVARLPSPSGVVSLE